MVAMGKEADLFKRRVALMLNGTLICKHPHKYARGLCKACYRWQLRRENPAHAAKTREESRAHRVAHPRRMKESLRAWNLRKSFGLSLADYEAMLSSQGGKCAICGRPPGARSLAVDHHHRSGTIRGLLCFRCNYGLTWFSDNDGYLSAASRYVATPPALSVLGQRVAPKRPKSKKNLLHRRSRRLEAQPAPAPGAVPAPGGSDTSVAPPDTREPARRDSSSAS